MWYLLISLPLMIGSRPLAGALCNNAALFPVTMPRAKLLCSTRVVEFGQAVILFNSKYSSSGIPKLKKSAYIVCSTLVEMVAPLERVTGTFRKKGLEVSFSTEKIILGQYTCSKASPRYSTECTQVLFIRNFRMGVCTFTVRIASGKTKERTPLGAIY